MQNIPEMGSEGGPCPPSEKIFLLVVLAARPPAQPAVKAREGIAMQAKTTDLCDQYADELQVAAPIFRGYGGKIAFCGPISTVQVYEDNVLVRAALEEPGAGRVLVVDGVGSLRCALVGDQLATLGLHNGWAGVVINGCIRDVATLAG